MATDNNPASNTSSVLSAAQRPAPAANFPQFIVPGREREMATLNALHRLHYPPVWLDYPHRDPTAALCTLWDEWLTGPCLWADTADVLVCDSRVTITQRLKNSFCNKFIDAEGYVATHQHEGIGHQLGWPFPYWIHSPGGAGVHFSAAGTKSAVLPEGAPLSRATDSWTLEGATDCGVDDEGWRLRLDCAGATAAVALGPIDPAVSPFIQLRWSASDLSGAQPWLEWTTSAQPDFSVSRRMAIPLPDGGRAITHEMLPLFRHPAWKGSVTRLRLNFGNTAPGAEVVIQALFSQYDTRHNINNFDYIRGAIDLFCWTGDLAFMRAELPRLRKALRYAEHEFRTRENNCVLTPWIGHEGTSGLELAADGAKTIHPARGIGNNYWDLLPFGHKDAYATIRYYDTLVRMAAVEQAVDRHPEWNFPRGEGRFEPADLELHAAAVKEEGNRIFWSEQTGRFVAGPDACGTRHDYGFTFLNTDAVHYGFATDAHARQIMDWLDGKRLVAGDTSQGADIYRFRFGPRSTTRRNVEYYFWGWSKPEEIPFGGQVQDGGAVLGWSFMDLSSRLKIDGADSAWRRLREIVAWFEEVQAGGGYREYYRSQGTVLQGDGAAGGLGLDREFFESLLVPQIMLRGFLGFSATPEGCRIAPQLPAEFPSLTIDRIRIRGLVLSVTASPDGILLRKISGTPTGGLPFAVDAPGFRSPAPIDWNVVREVRITR